MGGASGARRRNVSNISGGDAELKQMKPSLSLRDISQKSLVVKKVPLKPATELTDESH